MSSPTSYLLFGLIVSVAAATDDDVQAWRDELSAEIDAEWILHCSFLIIFMQAGFAMLEAGTVSSNNVQDIVYKNLVDMCIGAIMFFFSGYALAYGDSVSGIFGSTKFALAGFSLTDYPAWFFQYTFASAAATIVSGAVAGRCKVEAYFIYSVLVSGFAYPLVAHWVWSEDGWLAKRDFVDFAGSGAVHMTGGFISLMGAFTIGPRAERFVTLPDGKLGKPREIPPSNALMQALGVFILWFGWYGFSAGSTLQVTDGGVYLAARVATTTTLSASSAALTSIPISKFFLGYYDLGITLNAGLAGLVSVTACAATVSPREAIGIGIIGAVVYFAAGNLILHFHIDDPLDAFAIHGSCGCWGVLATGLFGNAKFEIQLLGAVVIAAWAMVVGLGIFTLCRYTVGLRVSLEIELAGIDIHEHGRAALANTTAWSLDDILSHRRTRKALMKHMHDLRSEESLEFVLECRYIFDELDIDVRIDFIAEEKDTIPPTKRCSVAVWEKVSALLNTFILPGSEMEINVNCTLTKRIIAAFKEKAIESQRSTFGTVMRALMLGKRSGSYSEVTVGPDPSTVATDKISKAQVIDALSTGLDIVNECSATNSTGLGAGQTLSRELLVSLMDAYIEVHRLIFQNFYAKFCQTTEFKKSQAREMSGIST